LAEGWRVERQSAGAHWSANQPGLPISHAFRAGNYQYNNDESG